MNYKTIISLCALFVGCELLASPAATQDWVKNYVGTNSSLSYVSYVPDPVSFNVTNGTETAKVTFVFSAANKPALRVVSSNVAGITNGTVFAKDDYGTYCNYVSSQIETICCMVTTNRFSVQKINGSVVTNRIQSIYLTIGSGNSMLGGYLENGRAKCYGIVSDVGEVVISTCSVTEAERTKLITKPNNFSFLSLFFPSAYAKWIPCEKVYTGETREVAGGVEKKWTRDYYYDETESENLYLKKIDVEFEDGDIITVEIPEGSGRLIFKPNQGDIFDNSKVETTISHGLAKEIIDAIDSSELAEDWKLFLMDLASDGYFGEQISLACRKAISEADSGRPTEYPVTGWDFFADEEEEPVDPIEPDPDPVKPVDYIPSCSHVRASGTCGNWRCSACTVKLQGPSSHVYEQKPNLCAVCKNTYKGAVCGYVNMEDSTKHHFDGNGDETGCICINGHHWNHPSWGQIDNEWTTESSIHYKKQKCTRCNYKKRVQEGPHSYDVKFRYLNDSYHFKSNVCSVCNRVASSGQYSHVPRTSEPDTYIDNEDHLTHKCMYVCKNYPDGCDCSYMASNSNHIVNSLIYEIENMDDLGHRTNHLCRAKECGGKTIGSIVPHTYNWSAGTIVQNAEPATGHHTNVTCSASGCGYTKESASVAHTFDEWILSQNIFALDKKKCSPCGYTTNNIPHSMAYEDMVHWCRNGGGHLYGPHTYNKEDNPRFCTMCGRPDAKTEEEWSLFYEVYDLYIHTVECDCGCCSATYYDWYDKESHGYIIPGSSSVTCPYGWSDLGIFQRCGCPACASHFGDCLCAPLVKMNIFIFGPYAGPIAGSNQN